MSDGHTEAWKAKTTATTTITPKTEHTNRELAYALDEWARSDTGPSSRKIDLLNAAISSLAVAPPCEKADANGWMRSVDGKSPVGVLCELTTEDGESRAFTREGRCLSWPFWRVWKGPIVPPSLAELEKAALDALVQYATTCAEPTGGSHHKRTVWNAGRSLLAARTGETK